MNTVNGTDGINNNSLSDVIYALRQNIMKNLHVAEVCKVTEVKSSTQVVASPINNSAKKLFCYNVYHSELHVNDTVLVIFTDTDTRVNVNRMSKGVNTQNVKNATQYHSLEFGIVIGASSGGSSSIDIQVDGISIVVDDVANFKTTSAYNATTNRFVMEQEIEDFVTHDDGAAVNESTLLDNYYTKTQCDNKYVVQTGFTERYLYYGALTNNTTYTFGNTLTATMSISNGGTSIAGTTHGRPVMIAGKLSGTFTNMYNARVFITIDDTDYELLWTNNTGECWYSYFRVVNLSAGTHTFTFKVDGNHVGNAQTLQIMNWDTSDFTICEL